MAQHVRRQPRRIEPGFQRQLLEKLAAALPRQVARRRRATETATAPPSGCPHRSAGQSRRGIRDNRPRPAAPARSTARSAPCRPCRARPESAGRGAPRPAAARPAPRRAARSRTAARRRSAAGPPPRRAIPKRPRSAFRPRSRLRIFGNGRPRRGGSRSAVGSSGAAAVADQKTEELPHRRQPPRQGPRRQAARGHRADIVPQRRGIGAFERGAARREKDRKILQIGAISAQGQSRRAAFGRERLEKGLDPPPGHR